MKKIWAKAVVLGIVLIAVVLAFVWWRSSGNFDIAANDKQAVKIVRIEEPKISIIEKDKIVPQPVRIVFSKAIAQAGLIDNKVVKGIEMHPALRGTWSFKGASILIFVPDDDWLPDVTYDVSLSKGVLAAGIKLKDNSFSFKSPVFSGKEIEKEFYEDLRNRRHKSVVAGFEFSYPVDEASIKKAVNVRSVNGQKYDFTYKLVDKNRRLYVLSEPLKITQKADFVTVKVEALKNEYNGKVLNQPIEAKVKVPSIAEFFNVKSVTADIVRDKNKDDRPEQVLKVGFTGAVEGTKAAEYINLFYSSTSCFELKEQLAKVLNDYHKVENLTSLATELVAKEQKVGTDVELKYNLEQRGKCLVAVVKKGLSSADGFMLTTDQISVLPAADYPMEAKIVYEGAVLPLTQKPQLEFASRGVKTLKVKLARIESGDLNNLVTQTGGQFAHPYFLNYNFNEYNMAEVFEKDIPLNLQKPADVNYASLNLKPYIGKQKGIFLVSLRGAFDDANFSAEDRRLVIVTDLGLVVKDNLDKSHDVFVASLTKEKPIAGAKVEVLGRNGISVAEVVTDTTGHAKLPDLSGFENEKQPVVYKVSLNGDVSYLPVERYELKINYSKFAVEGIYVSDDNQNGINAYIFSDRGVYRPGESVNLGLVVRQNNLAVPENMPFEIQIITPRGETAASAQLKVSTDGLSEYTYNIPAKADTGFYNLTLYRQNDKKEKIYVASSYFRVEEFEADTMKIKLTFDGKKPKGWIEAQEVSVKAALSNLYGAPAVGHILKGQYNLNPGQFYFKEYEGFTFNDPLRKVDGKTVSSHHKQLEALKSDENGEAVFKINLNDYETGTYHLQVRIDGMEAGAGRGVSGELSTFVSPSKYLVGYKADGALLGIKPKSKRAVEVLAIDNNLKKIAKTGLKLTLKEKKDVSNLVEMPNGTYRYQTVIQDEVLKEENFDIAEKGSKIELETAKTGRFVLQLSDGEAIVASFDYTVQVSERLNKVIDKAATLDVLTDKKEYTSGDEIQFEVKAPYEGYGLVTIERDSVYAYKWFKASEKNLSDSIKLPDTVEGNAYLNVLWFRSLSSDEIFRSPMSYAVVPFTINKKARDNKPDLSVPEKVRPGDKLVIKYKTEKPSQIIIWGVNEGILQVADYETPDPLAFFLKKKALRVVTAQIMDMIMPDVNLSRFFKSTGGGAFAKKMMRNMAMAEMADAVTGSANPFARKLTKVTAFWSGILSADATEKEFVYEVPETFSGQIRVMAVAVNGSQFGSADKDVLVRGDFAIVSSGPFSVTPGDEFSVGVGLANLVEGSGKDYKVKLVARASGGLEISGSAEQILDLPEDSEKTIVFQVKALDVLGPAEIHFDVISLANDNKKSGMPYYVGIRPAVPYMSDLKMGYRKEKLKLDDVVLDLYPQYRSQVLSASTSSLVLAEGLLKYLDKFEHGCTEQTISKAYPAVALMFKHPEMVDSAVVYEQFENAIKILTERQKINGGFAVWPVARLPESESVSLYAAEFLVEAERLGLDVPQNLLLKSLQYARMVASRKLKSIDDVNPLWAVYILTRNGEVTTNYLLNLENELIKSDAKNWRNTLGASYLAASYKMLQNKNKAKSVLGRFKPMDNKLDTIRYLYVMAENFPEEFKEWREENVNLLLSPLEDGYYNTWTSAYSILAMNAFAGEVSADKEITFDGKSAVYDLFANLKLDDNDQKITATSPNPFFYMLRQQGYRKGKIAKVISNGLEISKEYLVDDKPIDKIKLGDELEVVIRLRSLTGEDIQDVAVIDLLPGGTDIVRDSAKSESGFDFYETREDRLNAYLTVVPNGTVIRYKIKAVSRGQFVVPPVYASAMYDVRLNAHNTTTDLVIE